jgi:hypothetical protein
VRGSGSLVEYSREAHGGFRHERYESSPQRGAELEHPGRMVDRSHVEGVTGWAIGDHYDAGIHLAEEANSLYDKLERVILPLFYDQSDAYTEMRRSTIALNGSFFHTQRMVLQYLRNAYLGVEP